MLDTPTKFFSNIIIHRLRNYNVGRIKEVDLKYFALVKNPLLIEKCIGFQLDKQRIIPNREIFAVDPKKLFMNVIVNMFLNNKMKNYIKK